MSYSRDNRIDTPTAAALTENLIAYVWHSFRGNGDLALHWGVARRNPHDSLRPYRTFRPESFFEMPLFLSKLSFAASAVERQPMAAALEEFSKQMQALDTTRHGNDATEDLEPTGLGPILGKR